jgi:hypothetical protein
MADGLWLGLIFFWFWRSAYMSEAVVERGLVGVKE